MLSHVTYIRRKFTCYNIELFNGRKMYVEFNVYLDLHTELDLVFDKVKLKSGVKT